jgi:hypothetical protein
VLEGEVVEIGEERHVVIAGEALTFDSRLPHRFRDERLEQAGFVLAVTPPGAVMCLFLSRGLGASP